jgi:hypothetical protein
VAAGAVWLFSGLPTWAEGSKIAWLGTGGRADPDLIARLEGDGHTVTSHSPSSADGATQVALAESNDLVIISETISSGAVSTGSGGTFHLQNVETPVISFEPYMCDEARWTGMTQYVNFGNSGRTEAPPALQPTQDSIYITDPTDPLAGGHPAGALQVYTSPFNVAFGVPGPDARVVATADQATDFPCLFYYAAGKRLFDGTVTPGLRLLLFLGQNLQFDLVNDNGLALFDAAVTHALGSEPLTGSVIFVQ